MNMRSITSQEFDTIKSRPNMNVSVERDVEYWYETVIDEDGNEVAFASYHTGSEPVYTLC
jgi:hypothetical protein